MAKKKSKKEDPTILATLEQIKKKHNSPVFKGDEGFSEVAAIPSGSYTVDYALGIGGYPEGRIVEIYGAPSGGKSLITLVAIGQTQKAGGRCVLMDAEQSFDPTWARKLGVDTDELYIQQPDDGETALDSVKMLIKTGKFKLIVVDSVAALVSKKELEGDIGDNHVALQARLMAQALRSITGIAAKTGTTILFVNQIRSKIGVMFGNPNTTPGGKALKFYSSVRMKVEKKGSSNIKKGDEVIGHGIRIYVSKNKVAAPYKRGDFNIYYTRGIDHDSELVKVARKLEVITREGNTYHFGDNKWVGKKKLRDAILGSDELKKKVEKTLEEKLKDIRA